MVCRGYTQIVLNKLVAQVVRPYCSFESGVRVRFAPSPTGLLHLGGLRTALYNYAFAKSQGGKFILRIEDTDQVRLVPEALGRLQEDLQWAGLVPDEGPAQGGDYGPYIQSQRQQLYRKEVDKLIASGKAYHCFCTKRRLDLLRQNALKNQQVPKYDNHCRHLSDGEVAKKLSAGKSSCIRFKLEASQPFRDLIYGDILHEVQDIEGDPIIMKTDGLPTYHLANVVDDHHMKITHVIRGLEWLQSTNKHLLIYRAFGYKPPLFAHLPLLLNSDGSKLSKRHGDLSVNYFRRKGIYPRALMNFVTKAGSGFQTDLGETCYSVEELSKRFQLTMVNSNSCKLPMDRLPNFNSAEIKRKLNSKEDLPQLIQEVKSLLATTFPERVKDDSVELDDIHIEKVIRWTCPRISTIHDLMEPNFLFLWQKPNSDDLQGGNSLLLESLNSQLFKLDFTKENIGNFLKNSAKENGVPFKSLMMLLRSALSGLKQGPGVAEMIEILGKETTIKRLERAISILKKKEEQTEIQTAKFSV